MAQIPMSPTIVVPVSHPHKIYDHMEDVLWPSRQRKKKAEIGSRIGWLDLEMLGKNRLLWHSGPS